MVTVVVVCIITPTHANECVPPRGVWGFFRFSQIFFWRNLGQNVMLVKVLYRGAGFSLKRGAAAVCRATAKVRTLNLKRRSERCAAL